MSGQSAIIKIIAIDGPAGSGKGTLARNLAAALGFAHMDTGAIYRAVAFTGQIDGLALESEAQGLEACRMLQARLAGGNIQNILSDQALRTDEVAQSASRIAAFPAVRKALIQIQKDFAYTPPGGAKGSVLDGRDIGTVICPDAGLKLFVTADTEIRAQRRKKELHSKGINITYEAVLEDMRARDARDSGRDAAPLKPAADAVIIDSSHLAEKELLDLALHYAKKAFG